MKRKLFTTLIFILILAACSSSQEATTEVQPAEPAPATNTPLPPEPTPTPEPVIFIDEFDGGIDNSWSWINQDPERWSITEEGWLSIRAANPGLFASEGEINQVNLLLQPAPEGSFVITTRLYAAPSENFQQAGIFMIHDGVNYVSALNAFCEICIQDTGGHGFFLEAFKNGEYAAAGMVKGHGKDITDLYLRLVYDADNNTVTGYAAAKPDEWQELGVIEGLPPIQQIGLGAANIPSPEGVQEDLLADFAYFEVSRVETPVRTSDVLPKLPEPTSTPEPTATLEPTPLPEGVLFRDDFEGYLQPGWTWINEEPDRWTFTGDGWLEITGSNLAFYSEGDYGMTNFLTRPIPEGEFMIEAHIKSNPNENFQQAAIYIFQDQSNYVALNIGFCGICQVGGAGFFMETFIDNNPFSDAYQIKRDPQVTDIYLRLVNEGGSITGYYATTPGEWQRAGAFGNFFEFKLVGLGTTNSNSEGNVTHDIVSSFDYFEIALPE